MNTYSEDSFTNLPIHPENFKNRKQELDDARFQLLDRRVPTLMFWGEAGVGKTSLALHLAYELIQEGVYHSIIWTTAKDYEIGISNPLNRTFLNKPFNQYSQKRRRRSEGVFVSSLLELYQTIILNSGFFDEHYENELDDVWEEEEGLEYSVLAWLKARRILLFLDDLDSWEKNDWRYVLKFVGKINFPSAAVITSRRNIDPLFVPGVAPIRIGPLDLGTLRELFDDYVDTYQLKINNNDKNDILKYSEGSPLILNLVLGLIEIRSRNWFGFNKEISSDVLNDIENSINSSKPIEEFLFQDLFEYISSQSKTVMLAIAALKHSKKKVNLTSISKFANLENSEIQNSINELQAVSLINRYRADRNNYDVHPLLMSYLMRTSRRAIEEIADNNNLGL